MKKLNKSHFKIDCFRLTTACTIPLLVATSVAASQKVKMKQAQPNILVIYTDDQRYDALGANENKVIITPVLDELLSKGVRFNQAHVAYALSSPSRAAMLTGRYGSQNGVLDLKGVVNEGEVSVAQLLQEQGYTTAINGKWHLHQKPEQLGFDEACYFNSNGRFYKRTIHDHGQVVKPTEHCDSYCADKSVDFLRRQKGSDKPFFLYHCTQLPHMNHKRVWNALDETKAKYNVDDMPVAANHLDDLKDKPAYLKTVRNRKVAKEYGYPDTKAIQKHTRDYYSVITEMDSFLQRIIDELEAQGLMDNTYIFFMGDNGWMLGDHGFTSKVLPYRASTHVPFFVLGPGIKHTENNSLVSNIDIAPTMLELAGTQVPENMHGKSLLPILQKGKSKVRKAFVYEGLGKYGGAKPELATISGQYRYIVTFTDHGLKDIDFQELYDIEKDPDEMHNLAGEKKYKSVIKKLSKPIAKHRKKVLGM